jgi:hypothetical protein
MELQLMLGNLVMHFCHKDLKFSRQRPEQAIYMSLKHGKLAKIV